MATNQTVKVLDQVLLIQLEPHIWSGRKKLQPEDLQNVDSSDLPPTDLATLGSKKIVDTEKLKVFDTLKKRAQRACELRGVRFLGGYAIPLTKVTEVAMELDAIEHEFNQAKDDFVKNYKGYVDAWLASHPSWAHCIKASITHVGHVEAAIGFTWQAIHVKEPKGKGAQSIARGLTKQVNGLSDQLFKEISASAEEMLGTALHGKDKVTQKALNRVRQLRDKLHDLSFLNSNVQPLVESIDYTLTLMPKTGLIEGASFDALYQLVSLLGNPIRAMQHGQSILQGKPVAEAVSECVLGSVKPVTAPQPAASQPPAAGGVSDHDIPVAEPAKAITVTEKPKAEKNAPVPSAPATAGEEDAGPLCLM